MNVLSQTSLSGRLSRLWHFSQELVHNARQTANARVDPISDVVDLDEFAPFVKLQSLRLGQSGITTQQISMSTSLSGVLSPSQASARVQMHCHYYPMERRNIRRLLHARTLVAILSLYHSSSVPIQATACPRDEKFSMNAGQTLYDLTGPQRLTEESYRNDKIPHTPSHSPDILLQCLFI